MPEVSLRRVTYNGGYRTGGESVLFEMPQGWVIVDVNWDEEVVDVTYLVPACVVEVPPKPEPRLAGCFGKERFDAYTIPIPDVPEFGGTHSGDGA
jgi:hypothetical protein